MRNRFDQQLALLNVELVTMGALCEEAVVYATKALFQKEEGMIARAEDAEVQIDQKEKDIENLCMKLLLEQQPVARDLRVISSALKMISDMERIGDQAADIAEIVKYMEDRQIPNSAHLKEMSDFAAGMVTESINSFVNKDLELAKKVIVEDDVVDDYFEKVKSDLIAAIARSGQEQNLEQDSQFFLDLLMIAKYIERVGDHATNIAEWVVYSITGSHPEETN
ncbi:MAG: phosphate signaling complex protein PhoU [Firmicutes bacterium]|nr:phosphate signaling complex protein PhoU [Bacillota bacterium]MDY5855715.1 phosphate signaling complex protein PhoU [Anaerovoracaceae bacterium]